MTARKPLNLVIVDSLNPLLLTQELAAGRLPALSFMLQAGRLYLDCVSVFPTVTPTALASLATGLPPDAHGIGGVMWYSREEDRYIHYWPSHQSLFQGTVGKILRDVLIHLNATHLRPEVSTIFQHLEAAGICCGSVNFPISRGPFLHLSRLPRLLRWLSSLPRNVSMRGPTHFWYGDALRPPGTRAAGILHKYGLTDARAGDYAARMLAECHPRFLLTYLNENDLHSHQHGPMNAAFSLHTVDAQLAKMLSAYGSWESAVTQARWLIVGDHSQSEIGGIPGYALNVYKAFEGLMVAPLARGRLYRDRYDLAIAPNDRSALIYLREHETLPRVVEALARWPQIAQIFWQDGETSWAMQPETGRTLAWAPGGSTHDARGSRWHLTGDLSVLDLRLAGQLLIEGDFPDALHRVRHALASGPDILINGHLGYEFTTGFTMGKGTHGSLHRLDSEVPLLAIGVCDLPEHPRITDLVPAIRRTFEHERRDTWEVWPLLR